MKLLLPFLLLLLGCSRPVPSEPLTPEHRAAMVDSVTSMLAAWQAAVDSRDANRVAAFYATEPDFRWIEDGAVRYASAEQVVEAYRSMMPSVRAIELTLDDPQVTPLAAGVALVTTVFTQKVTDTLGEVTGYAGALTMTAIHADSGWRFLAGHTSAAIPRVTMPGLTRQ